MTVSDRFPDITQPGVPLAPFTRLRVGGPAEFLVRPRSAGQLAEVLTFCKSENVPLRVLGSGVNLLVRDGPLSGVVVRLVEPAFTAITVEGRRVRAGCGAGLAVLVATTARHGLAGFETLVGIPATVGGALRCNAGDRAGEIGQFVRRIEVLDEAGRPSVRERDELLFGENSSNLDDAVLVTAEFYLDPDAPDALVKRLRKAWITRQADQPYPFQRSARVFQNPRGGSAKELLERAGLPRTRLGGAEVSDRNANYVITHTGATAADVLGLIELMRTRVLEDSGVDLAHGLVVW